jgi:membrane associated rhomboid family serine protease
VACCAGASAIANVVGTFLVGAIVLALPLVVLAFLSVDAAISGCIGGFIANMLLLKNWQTTFRRKNTFDKTRKNHHNSFDNSCCNLH